MMVQNRECKNPTGGDVKKGLKLLLKASAGDATALDEYLDHLDSMTATGTGMTVEDLDALPEDKKNELTAVYNKKVLDRVDFLMSSLRQGSSTSKDPQGSAS
jgi:hypothetical protein